MPASFTAIDAISPAFNRAKRQLFKPFQFGFWARMALVALATGEFYGSSGWGGLHFTVPSPRGGPGPVFPALVNPQWKSLMLFLPWILIGLPLLAATVLLWIYVSSVFRFILFDSVLNARCQIKEGWRQWYSQGARFFLWRICLGLAFVAVLALLCGAALLVFIRTGAFVDPRQHIVLLVLGGLGAFLALACLIVLTVLAALFARDFVVPVMALENVGVIEAWRRVIAMLKAEKGAYAGYVLMKIVLVVGSAIIFGILTLLALLIFLVPLSVAGYGAYSYARAAGLLWNFFTIAFCVIFGGAAVAAIFYVIAFVSAPAMVFFQSYMIHFLGARYPRLGDRLFTPPAAPPLPDASASPAG
ncbi:MAG: hypothetical protein P8Z30_17220 [Acidobacteriota bacterium]